MGKPKKRTSARRTGARRSHLIIELARAVNAKSPVQVFTTGRESGKKLSAVVKAKSALFNKAKPTKAKKAKQAAKA